MVLWLQPGDCIRGAESRFRHEAPRAGVKVSELFVELAIQSEGLPTVL
jgi:hypothetical protein